MVTCWAHNPETVIGSGGSNPSPATFKHIHCFVF